MIAMHLRISGVMLMILGLAHGSFGGQLNWKADLAKLSLVNRQIFQVHTFYIALLLLFFGGVSAFLTEELLRSQALSRAVLGAGVILWEIRLYIQCFVFDPSLWRENRFNRSVHYLLTVFWIYLTAVNAAGLWEAG